MFFMYDDAPESHSMFLCMFLSMFLCMTTLLNHILNADHGKRLAVIENEFGEAPRPLAGLPPQF